MKVCPLCESPLVEELVLVWTLANEDKLKPIGEVHPAALYTDRFYCQACDTVHPELTERDEETE